MDGVDILITVKDEGDLVEVEAKTDGVDEISAVVASIGRGISTIVDGDVDEGWECVAISILSSSI